MAEVIRTTRKQSLQTAGVILGGVVAMNSLFMVMSSFYYADKPQLAINIASVRIAFVVLSVIVAAMSYAAALAPRFAGHAIGFIVGVAAIVGGIATLSSAMPWVVGATLLVIGALMPVLVWKSVMHSRSAWAFLISMLAVLATITFFGAPKIRNVLGIGLWHTLIIPCVQIVGVVALAMVRGEYRDRA